VPAGVWDEDEYEKLPGYDSPIAEQPPSVFLCHQQDGRLCAGWVACHDMEESLGLRVATVSGIVSPDVYEQTLAYTTDVPLFASGAEAALHGLSQLDDPGPQARALIAKLSRKVTS
jgi:hypothetical protein